MLVENSPTVPSGTLSPGTAVVRVVDDEPSIRALFERMVAKCGFAVECYDSADSFLTAFDDDQPGCLVIDLLLPDRSGLEVLRELRERGSQIPVVLMSGMARVSEAVQALKLGSIDFIEKPFELSQIADVLRRAVAIDVDRRRTVADRESVRQRFESLTPRELQVMEHIVRGAANKEVAAALGLSHKTVEVHRANVMRKTRAGSLAELVRMHVATWQ